MQALAHVRVQGLQKKARMALRWALELLFAKDIAQYLTLQSLDRLQRRMEYLRYHPMIAAQASQTRPPEQALDSEPQRGTGHA